MGKLFTLAFQYGPAAFAFIQQHGPFALKLVEAVRPVLREMVDADVPHADKVLGWADQASDVVSGIIGSAQTIERTAARPEGAAA